MASFFYNSDLRPQSGPGLELSLVGCQQVFGEPDKHGAEDRMDEGTLEKLSVGLDDLRRLGEVDLRLNHPQLPVAPPQP